MKNVKILFCNVLIIVFFVASFFCFVLFWGGGGTCSGFSCFQEKDFHYKTNEKITLQTLSPFQAYKTSFYLVIQFCSIDFI